MKQKSKETMTSRERVIATTNHIEPDRMPIDLGGFYSTGISAFAYYNLRKHLNMSVDNIEIADVMQFLPRVDEDILKRFHCDCILLDPGYKKKKIWNPRGEYNFLFPSSVDLKLKENGAWELGSGEKPAIMPKNGFFFDGPMPKIEVSTEEERLERFAKEAERIYKDTDFYTMYVGYYAYFTCDDVDWQCGMLTDPEEIKEELTEAHKQQINSVRKVIDKMGKYIQAITINSDLGSQNAPLVNPKIWKDISAPFIKSFCDFVHQNSDLKIFMHSCGAINDFLPTLIECGVDIINPVQISANNMQPKLLKEKYGDKITFWGGGCDTQRVLNGGDEEKVRENVKELTKTFKPGGGFVFNQVHNIMGDVRPENIVALFDTAYEESFY